MRKEGNNPYNNRVIVDFKKRTVKFVPIGKKGIRKYYYMFLVTLLMSYMYIVMIPLAVISIIITVIYPELNKFTSIIMFYGVLQAALMSFYFSLYFFNKKWRSKHYPELNAKLVNVLAFGRKAKKKTIEPKAMIDNKVILPHFNNIWLKYKVTKDFAKQLSKIKIVNIFKADPLNWNCCFEFKRKPKDGILEVEYA